MPSLPKAIHIYEEGPREGFQIEKGPLATEDKIRLIDALSETGVKHIQIGSFVDPRRVPSAADADAVVSGIKVRPGIDYSMLWMNERGLRQALSHPQLTVDGKIRMYPSDAFLKSNMNRTQEQNRQKNGELIDLCRELGVPVWQASVTSAFGCNFEGEIAPSKVLSLVQEAVDTGKEHGTEITQIVLADSMAWGTPLTVKRLVGAVQDRFPDLVIRLHLHDTRGMGIANAYAGLEMGIEHFDSSVAGLGGCPFARHKTAAGNVCTEDLVLMCDEMGIETGIDLDALIHAAEVAEDVVGHPITGCVSKAGSLSQIRRGLRAAA